jgi:hypothetical protein
MERANHERREVTPQSEPAEKRSLRLGSRVQGQQGKAPSHGQYAGEIALRGHARYQAVHLPGAMPVGSGLMGPGQIRRRYFREHEMAAQVLGV